MSFKIVKSKWEYTAPESRYMYLDYYFFWTTCKLVRQERWQCKFNSTVIQTWTFFAIIIKHLSHKISELETLKESLEIGMSVHNNA